MAVEEHVRVYTYVTSNGIWINVCLRENPLHVTSGCMLQSFRVYCGEIVIRRPAGSDTPLRIPSTALTWLKRHLSTPMEAHFFFSVALPAHSRPRPLIQFRNHFSQTVGLLGRVIIPSQGRYLNTGQHEHRINAYTHQTSMP
jgi:hypothetical protein